MKYSKLFIVICIVFAIVEYSIGKEFEPEEAYPSIKMTFINNSTFPIYLHLYEQDTLIKAHFLKPKNKFELMVDHGSTIHLEYPPPPYKTVLKPVDSTKEISRTVTFIDDGEHVRIKEKFIYQKNAKIENKKKKKDKEDESR